MEIKRHNNQQALVQALASTVKNHIGKLLRHQDLVTLAVPTDDLAADFLTALSQQSLDWSRVIVMLTDERVVSTQHPDSQSCFVTDHLCQHEAKNAVYWSYLDTGAIDNEDGLQQYANKRFAQPDIVILGMGLDGHTASIFPESPQFETLISAPAGILVTDPKTAPHLRLTLTLGAILASQHIYITFAGDEKMTVFAQAKQGRVPQWPISYVFDQSTVPVDVYTA